MYDIIFPPACHYKKVKSSCNPDTNKQTISFNLISGDPKKCKKSNKVTERTCKKGKTQL